MKKSKISVLFFSCAVMFMSLVGCGSKSSSSDNSSLQNDGQAQEIIKLRVGLVTDEGGLGDKSFNDAAYEGLEKIEKDLGFEVTVVEPKQASDYQAYMDRISKNNDVVLGNGYKLRDTLDIVSEQNIDVKYIMIDGVVERDNVYNLTFKEEEGSFLAGVLAGLTTKTNKIGFIGGTETPLVKKFESGFIAGVKSVNAEAGKLLEEGKTVRYAGTFSDTSRGYEMAKSLYNDGVDIIYHAAGGVGIGMFRAAKETGNYGIGVDQDQALSLPEYSDVILTSVVKNLRDVVYNVVEGISKGTYEPGTTQFGLKENGIYLAPISKDKVSQEILDKVEEYKNKIINGEIVVPATIEELSVFTVQ